MPRNASESSQQSGAPRIRLKVPAWFCRSAFATRIPWPLLVIEPVIGDSRRETFTRSRDGDARKSFRTAEHCRFGRDSLLWIGINDRRSLAMTARACPQGIPEFLATLNQGRRDLSHCRQARRAAKGQASWTERLSGGLLEDDCHCVRRIHESMVVGCRIAPAGTECTRTAGAEKRNPRVMYAAVPTRSVKAQEVALYSIDAGRRSRQPSARRPCS